MIWFIFDNASRISVFRDEGHDTNYAILNVIRDTQRLSANIDDDDLEEETDSLETSQSFRITRVSDLMIE